MREASREGFSLPDIHSIASYVQNPIGLDSYLRQTWVYVKDPEWTEFVRTPEFQLEVGRAVGHFEGDCDDAATFAGAILLVLGYECRFEAYRMPGKDEFGHVNVRCFLPDGSTMDIDPTVPEERLPVQAEETMEVAL